MRPLLTHCANMSSFPAANTFGSLDVQYYVQQLWIHARFVQGGWRGGHVAPQGASGEVATTSKRGVQARLVGVQGGGGGGLLPFWWVVRAPPAPPQATCAWNGGLAGAPKKANWQTYLAHPRPP
jgi:hypothetical protein